MDCLQIILCHPEACLQEQVTRSPSLPANRVVLSFGDEPSLP